MTRARLPRERAFEEAVREYYDKNTHRFLRLGGSAGPRSIHRAIYGPGVRTREEALSYANHLVLDELNTLGFVSQAGQPVHVLDLGCGVGGSLFFLARHWQDRRIHCTGVTISPVQCQIAQGTARALGLEATCQFHAASYLELPPIAPVDLAFAIESFVLGPNPAKFFTCASSVLRPGGRLVIIDDFLSTTAFQRVIHPQQSRWIRDFERGWHAGSLLTVGQTVTLARRAGLKLLSSWDWTPSIHILQKRDTLVRFLVDLGSFLPLRLLFGSAYWDSLIGGNALQLGTRYGIFQYHLLTFEKPA